jgi:hypothetical protein
MEMAFRMSKFKSIIFKTIFIIYSMSFCCHVISSEIQDALVSDVNVEQQTTNPKDFKFLVQKQLSDLKVSSEQQRLMINELSSQIHSSENIGSAKSSFDEEITKLKNSLDAQKDKIVKLQNKLDEENGFDFEFWMAIMLTGVTVLLTIIGIGIAILSLFGFRNMLKKSAQKASEVAGTAAENKAEEVANSAINSQLIKYIEEGRFDRIIALEVEKQTYRGIGQSYNFDNDEQ